MKKLVLVFVTACSAVALAVPSAFGSNPLWIGFHDDPVLRYGDADARAAELDKAQAANASMLRTLVTWSDIAPERPANASNPFDSAYAFQDLDDLVRSAQARGMEMLITIWGTPKWANGGKGKAFLPTNMKDFENFSRAVASRYSGRFAGYPFVRFYGIWNESNRGGFLSPQFNAAGKIVGPALYAKLAAAGYKGIKAGNKTALVAVGETSSNGTDRPRTGTTEAVAPATFARLVATSNKKLKFDAWAHHPYPYPVSMKALQKVRYPNVALTSLPRFESDIDKWFGRKNIPIWITEYGSETRPAEPKGVTESQQATYVNQAITVAKNDPRVAMFIWFVFRDSDGSLWQSGLYQKDGAAKPSLRKFTSAAKPLNARNPHVTVKGGTKSPVVSVPLRTFCVNNPIGASVGAVVNLSIGSKPIGTTVTQTALAIDCTAPVRIPVTIVKGQTYLATIALDTKNGSRATVDVTVVGA